MNPSIEPSLRRKRKEKTDFTGIFFLILGALLLWLLTDILTARAQSVLVYSELREEAIWKECEDKLRSL